MKKLTGLIILTAILFSCFGSFNAANAIENTQIYEAQKIPSDYFIKLDGKADTIWSAVEGQKIERVSDYGKDAPTDATGTIKFLWNEKGVYVLVEIDKKAPLTAPCLNQDGISATDDTVEISVILGGDDMSAENAANTDPTSGAFCGIFTGDADGNSKNLGWFSVYSSDSCKYSYYIVDEQSGKFNVEMFISWVRPYYTRCYGENGAGVGTLITLDARVYLHNADGSRSVICWNATDSSKPTTGAYLGYILMTDTVVDENKLPKAGDVNCDGQIKGNDATALLKYLAGWDINLDKFTADCDGDGKIGGKDITTLLKYLAGWDVNLG